MAVRRPTAQTRAAQDKAGGWINSPVREWFQSRAVGLAGASSATAHSRTHHHRRGCGTQTGRTTGTGEHGVTLARRGAAAQIVHRVLPPPHPHPGPASGPPASGPRSPAPGLRPPVSGPRSPASGPPVSRVRHRNWRLLPEFREQTPVSVAGTGERTAGSAAVAPAGSAGSAVSAGSAGWAPRPVPSEDETPEQEQGQHQPDHQVRDGRGTEGRDRTPAEPADG